MGKPHVDALGPIGKLVDVRGGIALAAHLLSGSELTEMRPLVVRVEGDHSAVEAQGGHGLQVDRAADAAHHVGLTRLVDGHAADKRGGVLVVLKVAVVARGGLLDAVKRAHVEVRIQAANGDLLVASVDALAGQARQAHEVVCDADIRKLADVLGRDDLDDGV